MFSNYMKPRFLIFIISFFVAFHHIFFLLLISRANATFIVIKVIMLLFSVIDEDYERKGEDDSMERSMQGLRWDTAGVRKVTVIHCIHCIVTFITKYVQ